MVCCSIVILLSTTLTTARYSQIMNCLRQGSRGSCLILYNIQDETDNDKQLIPRVSSKTNTVEKFSVDILGEDHTHTPDQRQTDARSLGYISRRYR